MCAKNQGRIFLDIEFGLNHPYKNDLKTSLQGEVCNIYKLFKDSIFNQYRTWDLSNTPHHA